METPEQFLDRAMKLLQRSDPIPKLLPQVRLGRMPKDSPALTAILDSWLEAFIQVLKDAQAVLDIGAAKRLDPNPRLAVLVEWGVLAEDDLHGKTLRGTLAHAVRAAHHGKSRQ